MNAPMKRDKVQTYISPKEYEYEIHVSNKGFLMKNGVVVWTLSPSSTLVYVHVYIMLILKCI